MFFFKKKTKQNSTIANCKLFFEQILLLREYQKTEESILILHKSGNLRVDSFQVMFGVPFGPEIDIWSLGCILAEVSLNYLPTCVINQC